MISKDVRFWGISMFPFGLVRLHSHSGSVQYKLLYNTPLPSIRKSSRCYRTDVWSRTPAHKIKSLQEITVCSPHWILKGGNVLPVWWQAPTTNSNPYQWWVAMSSWCIPLWLDFDMHSRLMKPFMNHPSRVFCSGAPELFQWRNNVFWKPDSQRIPVSLLLLLRLAFMST